MSATNSPIQFSRDTRNAAVQMQTKLTELLDKKRDDPAFAGSKEVTELQQSIDLASQQRTTSYDAELTHYRKVDRTLGGAVNFNLKR